MYKKHILYIYIYMCVCVYIYIYVCMYVHTYVCTHLGISARMCACVRACSHACTHGMYCTAVSAFLCTDVCGNPPTADHALQATRSLNAKSRTHPWSEKGSQLPGSDHGLGSMGSGFRLAWCSGGSSDPVAVDAFSCLNSFQQLLEGQAPIPWSYAVVACDEVVAAAKHLGERTALGGPASQFTT